jgi:hypothetical protein
MVAGTARTVLTALTSRDPFQQNWSTINACQPAAMVRESHVKRTSNNEQDKGATVHDRR